MRKLISFKRLFITLFLVFLIPNGIIAQIKDVSGVYFKYDNKSRTATITYKDNDKYKGNINIPKTISMFGNTYKVTKIDGFAFRGCSELTGIHIPSSIDYIPTGVFSNCSYLRTITVDKDNPKYDSRNNCNAIISKANNTLLVGCQNTIIPNTVTARDDDAFEGCVNLKNITVPNSVNVIGMRAFKGCSNLRTITVDKDNPKYDSRNNCNAIISKANNTLILGCQNTIIPNTVTAIGDDAFGGCVNLKNITVPNSVKVIGKNAFSGCSSLTRITIQNGVVEIGETAFAYCHQLKNINLPPGLKTIGKGAFYECKSLSSIVIPDGVTSLDGVFDHCPALKTIVLPKGLNHLNGTFKFCTFLSHIDIPSSVRYLGRMSFQNCSALETITIPSSVKRINRGAFWDCKNLKTVKVYPQTEIEDNIFTNCPNAKIVKINSVVQTTTPDKKPIVDNKPSVEFSKIWLEHGAEENGQKGMKVHMNMTSHNLKGQKFTTTAYIDRPKYQGIKAKDNRYRLSNGNVAVTRDFTPTWDNTNYNDCTLFFPYSSFEIGPGKNTYYCRVFAFYNGSSIGNSQFESFDGTGPIASASENSNNGRNSTELKSITLNGSEMVGRIWGVLANPNERTMLNDVLQALRSRFPQSDFVEYKYGHFSDIRFNNFSMQWKDYQVEPSASFKKEKLSHYYYVIRFDRNKFKLHQVVELAHQFKREVEAGLPDMHLEDLNSSNIKGSVKYSTSYIDHKNRKISVSISVSEDITNFTLSIFIFPTSN